MLWAYTKLEAHLPVSQQAVSVWCSASYRDVHTSLLFTAPCLFSIPDCVTLLWVGIQGSPPAMSPSFPTHPEAHSQQPIPLPCNFVPSVSSPSLMLAAFTEGQLGREERLFCQQV